MRRKLERSKKSIPEKKRWAKIFNIAAGLCATGALYFTSFYIMGDSEPKEERLFLDNSVSSSLMTGLLLSVAHNIRKDIQSCNKILNSFYEEKNEIDGCEKALAKISIIDSWNSALSSMKCTFMVTTLTAYNTICYIYRQDLEADEHPGVDAMMTLLAAGTAAFCTRHHYKFAKEEERDYREHFNEDPGDLAPSGCGVM